MKSREERWSSILAQLGARRAVATAGGSIGDPGADKRYRLTQLAAQERVPLVFLLERAGHRPDNAHERRRPNDLQCLVSLSGQVPLVCAALRRSAGHGVLAAAPADFAVTTPAASLFAAGPAIVKAAIGEVVSKKWSPKRISAGRRCIWRPGSSTTSRSMMRRPLRCCDAISGTFPRTPGSCRHARPAPTRGRGGSSGSCSALTSTRQCPLRPASSWACWPMTERSSRCSRATAPPS